MLTLGIGCIAPSMDIYQLGLKQFWPLPCHPSVMNTRASKIGDLGGKNQVTMAGSVCDRDSWLKLFCTSNHIHNIRKTLFRAALTLAILPSCEQVGSEMALFEVKIRSQRQGHPWKEPTPSTTSYIGTNKWQMCSCLTENHLITQIEVDQKSLLGGDCPLPFWLFGRHKRK